MIRQLSSASISSIFSTDSNHPYQKVRRGNDSDDGIWDPNESDDNELSREYGKSDSDSESYDDYHDEEAGDSESLISRGSKSNSYTESRSEIPRFCYQTSFGIFLSLSVIMSVFYYGGSQIVSFFERNKIDIVSPISTNPKKGHPIEEENELTTFWSNVEGDDYYDDNSLRDNFDNGLTERYDDITPIENPDTQDDILEGRTEQMSSAGKATITTPNVTIQRISILGERNTGVDWFAERIQECYPDIEVTTSLSRPSFFFQDEKENTSSQPTIVLPIFLNPYDWVTIMRSDPQYMPNHMKTKDWKEFVTKPWTIEKRSKQDEELWLGINEDPNMHVCQMNFKYNEIISCIKDNEELPDGISEEHYFASYELRHDGSGKPYNSIVDMRAEKINNFMSVMEWEDVVLLLPVQYESLVQGGGFHPIEKIILEQTGLESQCDSVEDSFNAPIFWKTNYDQAYMNWMQEYIHWETEWLIGYDVIHYDKNAHSKKNNMVTPSHMTNEDSEQIVQPIKQSSKESLKGDWKDSMNDTQQDDAFNDRKINIEEKNGANMDSPGYYDQTLLPTFPEVDPNEPKSIQPVKIEKETKTADSKVDMFGDDVVIEIEEEGHGSEMTHEQMKAYVLSKSVEPANHEYFPLNEFPESDVALGKGDLSYLGKEIATEISIEENEVETEEDENNFENDDEAQMASIDPMPEELLNDDNMNL